MKGPEQQLLDRGLTRRRLLAGMSTLAGATVLCPELALAGVGKMEVAEREFLVSAAGDGPYSVSWVAASGAGQVPSAFRGHGAAQHPLRPQHVVMFARRPGNAAIEVDLNTGTMFREYACLPGRNTVGHGCFSADGKTLFSAEVDTYSGAGKIVLRDADSYQWLGEFDSYGIGLHELKLMPDGKTLVVANGGLLTRPETGRQVLNLESMESSLCYIDAATGKLLEKVRLDEPKASIRHLDVAADGTVALAIQMQRSAADHQRPVALSALHRRGGAIQQLQDPVTVISQLHDYMGSVAINGASRVAGFTSPKGNMAVFWNIDSGEFCGYHALRDVCGLAVSGDQRHFIVTSSIGQVRLLDARTLVEDRARRLLTPGVRWDNHLLVTGRTWI